jgi:prepilin-type N-terminal cleavage/methylation domain-containing protein
MLMKNSRQGFTLVEIMIVVMIIGLLAAMALPGLNRARQTAQTNNCINNLRQLESAKDQYALETGLIGGTAVTLPSLANYLKTLPNCPVGGTYAPGTVKCEANVGDFASCGAYNLLTHPATIGNP